MLTNELTGAALNWAVAKCEGVDYLAAPEYDGIGNRYEPTDYSTDWAQGGPIIEREGIDLHRVTDALWSAKWWTNNSGMVKNPAQRFKHNIQIDGPTPLVAAMRCYVASKLGDEVEVPKELR